MSMERVPRLWTDETQRKQRARKPVPSRSPRAVRLCFGIVPLSGLISGLWEHNLDPERLLLTMWSLDLMFWSLDLHRVLAPDSQDLSWRTTVPGLTIWEGRTPGMLQKCRYVEILLAWIATRGLDPRMTLAGLRGPPASQPVERIRKRVVLTPASRDRVMRSPRLAAMGVATLSGLMPTFLEPKITPIITRPGGGAVESLAARVISRFPFRPTRAGTRMKISLITLNTSQSMTMPAETIPRPDTRYGTMTCAAISHELSGRKPCSERVNFQSSSSRRVTTIVGPARVARRRRRRRRKRRGVKGGSTWRHTALDDSSSMRTCGGRRRLGAEGGSLLKGGGSSSCPSRELCAWAPNGGGLPLALELRPFLALFLCFAWGGWESSPGIVVLGLNPACVRVDLWCRYRPGLFLAAGLNTEREDKILLCNLQLLQAAGHSGLRLPLLTVPDR
ncbi:hypothetical protein CRUP_034302 [Coryphaenoides rupestris]|nr:hypothetical protein CRUP_034302 [Coryphaenoides rupestris]